MSHSDNDPALAETPAEFAKPMTYAIEQRIRMLDFLLARYGWVHREALQDFFGISIAQASLDIKRYIWLAPENITYNLNAKRYEVTATFERFYP